MGFDAGQWTTRDVECLVVAVTRNETTTAALLSILPVLSADPRVQVVFAVAWDRSAFSTGLESSLTGLGLTVVPWEQVLILDAAGEVSLFLGASHAGAPLGVRGNVLIVPHGYGRTRDRGRDEPARDGDIFPGQKVVHAAPHPSSLPFLPSYGERVVVGDPIFDSLVEGVWSRRHTRAALGIESGQSLVVVSSTWRQNSLFAVQPNLFAEIVAALPCDDYVVAAVVHPNVWVGHGRWQTLSWLSGAIHDGLRVIPFREGWRAAIAASDVVVGDLGSVTFYADLLGKRVLRVMGDTAELSSGSVMADQVEHSPRLAPEGDVREQVEGLAAPDPASVAKLVTGAVTHVGKAQSELRRVIYSLLTIPEPESPVMSRRPAVPRVVWDRPGLRRVTWQESTGSAAVRIERFGSTLDRPGTLVADLGLCTRAEAESASVVVTEWSHLSDGEPWSKQAGGYEAGLRRLLEVFPGAGAVVATGQRGRPGERVVVVWMRGAPSPTVLGLNVSGTDIGTAADRLGDTWGEIAATAAGVLALETPLLDGGQGVSVACGAVVWRFEALT